MGDEVRIDDVARRLIERSGKHVEIVYTGLRSGEKLHEELLGDGEEDLRPNHPLITQAAVPALTLRWSTRRPGALGPWRCGLCRLAVPVPAIG